MSLFRETVPNKNNFSATLLKVAYRELQKLEQTELIKKSKQLLSEKLIKTKYELRSPKHSDLLAKNAAN